MSRVIFLNWRIQKFVKKLTDFRMYFAIRLLIFVLLMGYSLISLLLTP